MSAGDQSVSWEPVALAATRWTMLRGWAIPLWAIAPVIGVPLVLTIVTWNPLWIFVIFPAAKLARTTVGEDQNRPREKWLGFISGQTFADRHVWGGATRDPLDV